ncbi:zinc-ribbon domain-containing protein [Fructilactobacillus sanfranciscensis]|uniref:zinc-ribbon domain-containing protein n=4 Tax=Fructilactobacillus sanfranciscensis TaxID=1625 RepID=UPI00111A0F03|nr:zinc ribbon domain-containing protein [Fructilactobacillus sanfranciscensis]TNK98664.1 hypothetical protein DK130_06775 [Fructilactobacillus sanfranciscensis]
MINSQYSPILIVYNCIINIQKRGIFMKFCPHCGNKVADDASFCDKCGNKLTVVSRQAHKNFNPLFLMPKKHNNLKILLINS